MLSKRRSGAQKVLQQVGHSYFLPVYVLPVSGLFLGIGTALTNDVTIQTYHLENILSRGKLLFMILLAMNAIGTAVIVNLPIILAKSIALGMAKSKKIAALLSSGLSFVVMHATISTILRLNGFVMRDGTISEAVHSGAISHVLGIPTLQMGAAGGIITGIAVAYLHNGFNSIDTLPGIFSKIDTKRFLPIICTVIFTLAGAASMLIWPVIQTLIRELDVLVTAVGALGIFVFGFIERLMLPFGLHHVFYLPFWETATGGTSIVDGVFVEGAQNIFYAEIASPNTAHFSIDALKYMAGKYPFMIGGLPGAAFAMYRCAMPSRRKQVGLLLLMTAGTSLLVGITEPIELTFILAAPSLYLVHCVLAGLSFLVMEMFNVAIGTTFSCGLLDLVLFGILQGNAKSSWLMLIPIAICYFALYYFVFRFAILKFNFMTPGRQPEISAQAKPGQP